MSPDRPPASDRDLVERFDATRAELALKQEQLELALGGFADADEFARAWGSGDASERNASEVVHGVFDRSHHLLTDLASFVAKLGVRRDLVEKNKERVSARLATAGVISKEDAALIEDHIEVRNQGQHQYLDQTPYRAWEAAHRQLGAVPGLQQKLTAWVEEHASEERA